MTAQRSTAGTLVDAPGQGPVRGRPSGRVLSRLLLPITVLLAGLGVLLLFLLSPRSLQAQEPTPTPTPTTVVRLSPPAQNVTAGSDVVVDVLVDDVSGLGAYEFELVFEPSVLSFVDVTNGSFLGSSGRSVTCLPPQLDVGTVRFGCVTIGTEPGASGSGVLATVRLGTSCAGSSGLDLAFVDVVDVLGVSIPTQVQGGSATVSGGGACPTPTPTSTPGPATEMPTPTSTPTSTPTPTVAPTPAPELCGPAVGTALCVLPVFQSTVSGSLVTLQIGVDNVTNLGAFQFELVFNDSLLSPVDIDVGPFLGSTGRTVVCYEPVPEPGRLEFVCVSLGSLPAGPDGSGILAEATFQAQALGLSPVHLDGVLLAKITGVEIPVAATQYSIVAVQAGPTPTPSPTATATRTFTPTPTGPTPTRTSTATPGPTPYVVLRVSPPDQTVGAGTDVVMDVTIEDAVNVGAYEFELAFEASVLSFVDVTNGSFLGSSGRSVTCLPPQLDVGTVRFGCVTIGTEPGASGSGVLATVRLGTSCAGSSGLDLAFVDVVDVLGVSIPSQVQGGSATVSGGGACPTPTPTSTPGPATDTPTPTATLTPTPTPTPALTPAPRLCGPATGLVLCLQPVSQNLFRGADTTVQVVVDGVTGLGAFQFTLAFNPAIVSAVDVAVGPFLGSTGRPVTCLEPPPEPGLLKFVCVSLAPEPAGPSGSGVLAVVTLRGEASGLTPLSLWDVLLTDTRGLAFPSPAVQGAAIFVAEPSTPTVTATPTVTLSPTPTLSPTATLSPTPCPPEGCPTPTVSPTPTITRTPTIAPTRTRTPTPTISPTATPTPGPLTLRVTPVTQTIVEGEAATVDMVVENARGLGAFQFTLVFNSSVVAFESMELGPFLGSTGRSVTCLPPILGGSQVEFVCVSLGAVPAGPDGLGVLATATFRGLSQGLSPLHLSDVILTGVSGVPQSPVTTRDGTLLVRVPPTKTPTATVTATATATPTPTPTVTATSTLMPTATPGAGALGKPFVVPVVLLKSDGDAPFVLARSAVSPPQRAVGGDAAQVGGKAGVFKEPADANLFLGGGPLIIAERVTGVPAGDGLGAFELHITYRADILSVGIEEGPFLTSTGRTSYCLKAEGKDRVRLSCFTTGDLPGPTGSGVLAILTVRPAGELQLRAAAQNGVEVLLDDITAGTQLADRWGEPIPVGQVGDARAVVRALEGDINGDCRVDVVDQQMVAGRFGVELGSLHYSRFLDLEPPLAPDGYIHIGDLQAVFGRSGSTCEEPKPEQPPPIKTPTPAATPGTSTPTANPTATAAATHTPTPTAGLTATPTLMPTPTSTATPTPSPTPTATLTPTATPTSTATPTPSPTPTATPCPDNDGDTLCDHLDPDDDNDGCTDERELLPTSNASQGGGRDPNNFWDFFDTPDPNASPQRDKMIRVADILRVAARYGTDDEDGTAPINRNTDPLSTPPRTGYHPAYDRGRRVVGPNPWNLAPPDGIIRLADIVAVLAQYNHDCA